MKIDKVAERQAEQKKLAIALATSIYHYKWIAAGVGIHETTIHDWLKNDKDFASQLDQARSSFINKNMRKAKPDFLLETADREIFGRKQDITSNGQSINIIVDGAYARQPKFRTDNDSSATDELAEDSSQ
jgi:hypothetical protein